MILPHFSNIITHKFFVSIVTGYSMDGDISYIRTDEGWLYLAVVIDLYSKSKAVVGSSIDNTMEIALVWNTLLMALWRRGFPRGLIFHPDRGIQYCSHDYQTLLKHHGIISSMSRKESCWDNSVAESFFNTIKTELVYHEHYTTKDIAKQSIFQYIKIYYNRIRKHSTIGLVSPMVFENQMKIVA